MRILSYENTLYFEHLLISLFIPPGQFHFYFNVMYTHDFMYLKSNNQEQKKTYAVYLRLI